MYTSTEVDLLDRLEPDVLPNDLGRDQDDRRAIAVGLVKPVDEVEAAGAAAAGAGGQTAGELRLGPGREGAGLLVPHVDPFDLAAVDGVRDPVQRVADDAVAPLHAGCLQRLDQYIGHSLLIADLLLSLCPASWVHPDKVSNHAARSIVRSGLDRNVRFSSIRAPRPLSRRRLRYLGG